MTELSDAWFKKVFKLNPGLAVIARLLYHGGPRGKIKEELGISMNKTRILVALVYKKMKIAGISPGKRRKLQKLVATEIMKRRAK